MSDRFLAFRCFGNYAWPPVGSGTPAETRAGGVVEIHYMLDGALQKMVGCVRWVPKSQWSADLAFNTPLKNLTTADAFKRRTNDRCTTVRCSTRQPGVSPGR